MKLVPAGDLNPLVCDYVGQQAGVPFDPALCQSFAVINDHGQFVAGVVISEYRDHDCQVSCASETSIAWQPHVCRAVFQYIFEQLGCVRCTSVTKKGNKRCRAFLDALGFTLEGNLRLGYDGVKDALIYGLLASECRYLEDADNGEESAEGSEAARSVRNGGSADAIEPGDGDSECQPEPHKPVHTRGEFRI